MATCTKRKKWNTFRYAGSIYWNRRKCWIIPFFSIVSCSHSSFMSRAIPFYFATFCLFCPLYIFGSSTLSLLSLAPLFLRSFLPQQISFQSSLATIGKGLECTTPTSSRHVARSRFLHIHYYLGIRIFCFFSRNIFAFEINVCVRALK